MQKTVDKKKLEKADAKIKQKNEKRDKEVLTNGNHMSAGPTTNQVIQKKDMKTDQSGKIVDIRIENFDLAYGSKYVFKFQILFAQVIGINYSMI